MEGETSAEGCKGRSSITGREKGKRDAQRERQDTPVYVLVFHLATHPPPVWGEPSTNVSAFSPITTHSPYAIIQDSHTCRSLAVIWIDCGEGGGEEGGGGKGDKEEGGTVGEREGGREGRKERKTREREGEGPSE